MKASLVMCTKNGGDKLRACLTYVEALEAPDGMDVHLVDNGSNDGVTFPMMNEYAAKSRFGVKVYQSFKKGNSAGRNVALPHVAGDLVLFIDDDCYPAPDFVREWTKVFEDGTVGYGSGMIIPFDRSYSIEGCNEYPHERRMKPRQFVWRGFLTGSNMCIRKTCLDQIGPFDERFGAGTRWAAEDWDMSLRASAKGWVGRYAPAVRVWHDHRRKDTDAYERWLYYDYGAGAIYAKHTFTGHGLRMAREFVRELRKLRAEAARRNQLVKGYRDFLSIRAGLMEW